MRWLREPPAGARVPRVVADPPRTENECCLPGNSLSGRERQKERVIAEQVFAEHEGLALDAYYVFESSGDRHPIYVLAILGP